MYVNFFDTVISADSPVDLIDACREARPALAEEISIVQREAPRGPDIYRIRGAKHSGYAVFDGESYAHIWTERHVSDGGEVRP